MASHMLIDTLMPRPAGMPLEAQTKGHDNYMLPMQVDVRALKQALWSSLQELRARTPDDAELDFQVWALHLRWST